MKSTDLYNRMEQDFSISRCNDNWSEIGNVEYITEQYLQRYMGLVTDNAKYIEYVYTAVFPSVEVIEKIISDNRRNALLFVHHPMTFDIRKTPVFTDISKENLQLLKERQISIYNLHTPLDANGEYSTTVNFARALGIDIVEEFYAYHNVNIGIIGITECKTTAEIKSRFEGAVGHKVALYQYGDKIINDCKVALVAGGGNDAVIYPQLKNMGINTYLTGITNMRNDYPPSIAAHKQAEECKINILSGTHYSTEKFACIKIVDYFLNLGMPSEFVSGIPGMEDL